MLVLSSGRLLARSAFWCFKTRAETSAHMAVRGTGTSSPTCKSISHMGHKEVRLKEKLTAIRRQSVQISQGPSPTWTVPSCALHLPCTGPEPRFAGQDHRSQQVSPAWSVSPPLWLLFCYPQVLGNTQSLLAKAKVIAISLVTKQLPPSSPASCLSAPPGFNICLLACLIRLI